MQNNSTSRVLIEHLYSPYCAGYRVVQILEHVYGLTAVSFNVIEMGDTDLSGVPSHILEKYHEITRAGRVPYGGLFFVNGRYVGSAFQDRVFEEVERLGVPRIGRPPAPLPHPQVLDQAQAAGTLIIRAITQDDLSGHGNPSPAYCTELQFGPHGNPETISLLAGWTGRYGCCMFGAYIQRQAAGFITVAPREEVWKLGWFEASHDPITPREIEKVLVVLCLHVYPGARGRGVATSLIAEVLDYARDRCYRKVIAYTGLRAMRTIGQSAGTAYPYKKNGFTTEVLIPPGDPKRPGDTGSRQYQGLARMTFDIAPRSR